MPQVTPLPLPPTTETLLILFAACCLRSVGVPITTNVMSWSETQHVNIAAVQQADSAAARPAVLPADSLATEVPPDSSLRAAALQVGLHLQEPLFDLSQEQRFMS